MGLGDSLPSPWCLPNPRKAKYRFLHHLGSMETAQTQLIPASLALGNLWELG